MAELCFEFAIIVVLILGNGFFAGAELALVSVRRGRVAQLAAAGDRRARLVEQLQDDPHRFLATVQVGVTLVGTMASAVGGATAIEVLKPVFQQAPLAVVRDAAEPLALFLVVGLIAYLSLILGELVPKALALEYTERVALRVARPISFLARSGGLAVAFLTLSSKGVLALLGVKSKGEQAFITKEEIRHLVAESLESGEVTVEEQEFIHNVFEFAQTQVREVMVPRPRIVGLDLDRPRQESLRTIMNSPYSRYPVYRGDVENVIGFVHARDLLGQVVAAPERSIEELLRPAYFVPEAKKIDVLLREMQRRRLHMALVVDEYGALSGLATTEDLLEELVGEIEDEHDAEDRPRIKRLGDGAYSLDALLSLNDLEGLLGVRFEDDLPCDTLAGLVLHLLGRFPEAGEQLRWQKFLLTCLEVTPTAIVRVKIEPLGGRAATR
jgi:putative hemolysin